MRRTVRLLALAAFMTLGAGAVAGPAPAFAQTADDLQAERARLRGQLDKVNTEIDALKRASGGVRDNYRLRARLADAESLARRLVEIEARLGIRVDGAAKPRPQSPPTAAPTDSPADLDAKADILADQSRRVRGQADALARRAIDAKGRLELRKRAADLDRDPFAPMEGSKRRVASGSGTGAGPAGNNTFMPAGAPRISGDSGPAVPGSSTGAGSSNNNPGAVTGAPLSVQLRDMLDTATLTDIRRLETTGAPGGSPQALERAAAALKARADWLDGQARSMRARAHAK